MARKKTIVEDSGSQLPGPQKLRRPRRQPRIRDEILDELIGEYRGPEELENMTESCGSRR